MSYDRLDRVLRSAAGSQEEGVMPEKVALRIEETLAGLPGRNARRHPSRFLRGMGIAAASIVAAGGVLFAVSNAALQESPIWKRVAAIGSERPAGPADTITLSPMIDRRNETLSITLTQVTLSSTDTEVRLNVERPSGVNLPIGYELTDDTGYIYQPLGSDSSFGPTPRNSPVEKGTMTFRFGPSYDKPDYLIFRPYEYRNAQGSDYRVNVTSAPTPSRPLVLPQGEAGSVYVTGIEYGEDETVVRYYVEGEVPWEQAYAFTLENEHGEQINRLDSEFPTNPYRYEFIKRYPPLSPDESLTFVAKPVATRKYLGDLEIRVPLSD